MVFSTQGKIQCFYVEQFTESRSPTTKIHNCCKCFGDGPNFEGYNWLWMIFPQKGWEGWKLVAKFLVLRIEISFQWQLKLVLTLLSEHNKTWRINKRIDEGNPERQSLTTLTTWGWLSSSNWIFDFTHTRSCNWSSSWSNSTLHELSSDQGVAVWFCLSLPNSSIDTWKCSRLTKSQVGVFRLWEK